jgi:hypothetical protein
LLRDSDVASRHAGAACSGRAERAAAIPPYTFCLTRDDGRMTKWRAHAYVCAFWAIVAVIFTIVAESHERGGFLPMPGLWIWLTTIALIAFLAVLTLITRFLKTPGQVLALQGVLLFLAVMTRFFLNG